MTPMLAILIILTVLKVCHSWQEWDYRVKWSLDTSAEAVLSAQLQWDAVWSVAAYAGDASPPRPRRGHSLHIIDTDPRSEYGGDTYIFLFGGRDNDQIRSQIPRTYNIESVNGTIVFTTYDEKPVKPCDDPDNIYYAPSEQVGCNFTANSLTKVGLFYNDVWAYKLCPRTERTFDGACNSTGGWLMINPGASQGGCNIELGITVCTHPSERYNHGSVLFDDGTLYVYGGYSQRCTDYCDDLWFFDIYLKSWREVYQTGTLTYFSNDTLFGVNNPTNTSDVPVGNSTAKYQGPGKRWRHTMVKGAAYTPTATSSSSSTTDLSSTPRQPMAIFGGHRLWHGYSIENSQTNNWDEYVTRPIGGYLNDLWIYTKYLDLDTFPGESYHTAYGTWQLQTVNERCYNNPGQAWANREDIACYTLRPIGRAGHGSVYDSKRGRIWVYAGYTTYFPYLRTDGSGSGPGITSVGSGGFTPYPAYEYFKQDLWYYDLQQELWFEVTLAEGSPIPDPRMDMILLLTSDDEVLFMHGGFSDNYIYGDTWYFDITTSRWLQKVDFVSPIYPASCTDDFAYVNSTDCQPLFYPAPLDRDPDSPFDILPYSEQDFYWPDPSYGPYFGILPKDALASNTRITANLAAKNFQNLNLSIAKEGESIFPYAATGPLQYARVLVYPFNATHNVTLVESCMSAVSEPTRGRVVDGLYGRSNRSVFIPQLRPQRPGWDGCRDRFDGRADLPSGLVYVQPQPRFGHRAIYFPNTTEIIVYGGMSYYEQQAKSLSTTYPQVVKGDMWYYALDHCTNNCSFNGDCYRGFCRCYVGYYGVDCSNISCPGTFCRYDDISKEQVCNHACSAGHIHVDGEVYVPDVAKLPCSVSNPGESNGICNGFGTAICSPPFIGQDCSIKDCLNNCSFNGWCSVEYPVSRCLCQPGYFGEYCQNQTCLNNCSYPHGVCNTTSGSCMCNNMYSPYNNERAYHPWAGDDCSFLFAYAAAFGDRRSLESMLLIVIMVFIVLLLLVKDVSGASCYDDGDCSKRGNEDVRRREYKVRKRFSDQLHNN